MLRSALRLIPLIVALMCAYLLVPTQGQAQTDPLRAVELEIIKQCNEYRTQNGLPPFEEHQKLSKAARGHSAEMLELGYFAHTSPNQACEHLKDRLVLVSYYDLTIGENIYKCRGYDVPELAQKAVEAWIRSPVHRKNLLNSSFNRIGVGVVGEGDTYLFTQCFSFLTVEVVDRTVRPKGSGYEVTVRCQVHTGPREGALLYQGRKLADWKADGSGAFTATVEVPGPGALEIGQTTQPHKWRIEVEMPPGL